MSKGRRGPKTRSLSEANSEDFSNKMNKRFDKAQDIEDDESRASHDESLVKRSNVLPHHGRSGEPRESSSGKLKKRRPVACK